VSEWVLSRAFRGAWPARLVHAMRLQDRVATHVHRIRCERWPASAPALRIAFASDFHAGPTTHPTLLEETARALAEAKPDVLLFGGDYVLFDARWVDALAPVLAAHAPLGRFAVLGNHDLWADDRRIVAALERAGVRVLVNEAVHLAPPFDHVSICGLDEPWTGRPDPRAAFEGARDVRVLLAHAPSAVALVEDRFDVCICGHTHGGHIALPGGIPIWAVGPLAREHPHGRHENRGRTVIVSRGIGGSESALRLFAPPDIRIVDLAG
jgi:predicted MPP superfamily phosphohydrolase